MSGFTAVVGSILPLSLTTCDGVAGLEVNAIITDCFGKGHGQIKMQDLGGGVYVDRTFEMPDVPFVIVQYLISDEKYEMPSERFDSTPKPSSPPKFIDGRVIKREHAKGYISGEVISETKIKK